LSGSTNPTTITMDADKSVTAVFVQPTVWPNSMAVMGDSISRAALADDTVDVVKAEQTDPEHPAVLRIGLARETTVAAPEATVVLVKTDQPGGEGVRIPVLLRPPRQAGSE
ncbi:MAG: hypothetical protein R6V12_00080, partial [Candidatus Hydrogenedentota bacterium]